MPPRGRRRTPTPTDAERVLGPEEASLLDVVDNVLNRGVVLSGDITIGLAHVDLVYARLSLLLCAADRVLPPEDVDARQPQPARIPAKVEGVTLARKAGSAAWSRRGRRV